MEEDLLARGTGFNSPQPTGTTVIACAIFRTSRSSGSTCPLLPDPPQTGSSSVTSSPTTTETRSSPSSSRQFRLPALPDHSYPPISAASPRSHFVNALLAFLDDVGGFCSSLASAWFSFAHYLTLCKDLSMVVSFKEGKTDEPRHLLHYLGFDLRPGLRRQRISCR